MAVALESAFAGKRAPTPFGQKQTVIHAIILRFHSGGWSSNASARWNSIMLADALCVGARLPAKAVCQTT